MNKLTENAIKELKSLHAKIKEKYEVTPITEDGYVLDYFGDTKLIQGFRVIVPLHSYFSVTSVNPDKPTLIAEFPEPPYLCEGADAILKELGI